MQYDFGTGGADIEFDVSTLSSGNSVEVVFGMQVAQTNGTFTSIESGKTYVKVTQGSSACELTVTCNSNTFRTFDYPYTANGHIRVIAHSYYITVYINRKWAHTFHFPYVSYRTERYVALSSASNETVTNIRLKELADWREAIFIDMESSGLNAISSVILQRPVEIQPRYTGTLAFSYDPDRSEVTLIKAKVIEENKGIDSMVASDAIVYFSDVAVVTSEEVARDYGFITRMYRFPDLEQDAIQAARITVEDAIRKSRMMRWSSRYNPELELGDIAVFSFNKVGTGTAISKKAIVESIRINVGDGVFNFEGNGRYGDTI